MNISINTNINLLRKNIAEAINVSQLPVGVLYYVLKDVLKDVETLYENTLQKELEEIQKEVNSEKEKTEEVQIESKE